MFPQKPAHMFLPLPGFVTIGPVILFQMYVYELKTSDYIELKTMHLNDFEKKKILI